MVVFPALSSPTIITLCSWLQKRLHSWAQWARNKGLSGGDSSRRFLTGQVEASRPSSALAARSQAGSPRLPAARAAVGGPAQRHLLPRDPAARPGAHDGADLRQTVEPLL